MCYTQLDVDGAHCGIRLSKQELHDKVIGFVNVLHALEHEWKDVIGK